MTISSTTNRVSFAGNGVTVAFATSPVVFFDSADLTVYEVVTATGASTLKTLTTDYTVTGGSGSTGTVTMLVAPATGTTLLIVRDVAITQGSDLVNNDASDAEVQEDAFDRLTMIAQQLDARIDRSFRLADSDVTGFNVELPDADTRANAVMGFDADGDFALYDPASAVTAATNVSFTQDGTGAVATTLDAKAKERVTFDDFLTAAQRTDAVTGSPTLNMVATMQVAINSGAKVIEGVPGRTYLVNEVGTKTILGTATRYCLLLPDGVSVDLRGSTVKLGSAQNACIFMNSTAGTTQNTDVAVYNGVLDGNYTNQTAPAAGDMACIYLFDVLRPRVYNLRVKNARQYFGRFLKCDQGYFNNLHGLTSYGDGWSFGLSASSQHMTRSFIDNIYAEGCLGTYSGLQGNGIIGVYQYCNVGKLEQKDCAGGLKIQDDTKDSNFGQLICIGQTNGTANSGVKIQGNSGSSLYPTRVTIDSIKSVNNFGNGLNITKIGSVSIGHYAGVTNGTGGSAAGSDQYDAFVDLSNGTSPNKCRIGHVEVDSPGTRGFVYTSGSIASRFLADSIYVRSSTGPAVALPGDSLGVAEINHITAIDDGSAMTFALQVSGTVKGWVKSVETNKAHSTGQSRVTIATANYDFEIGAIRLGSTDVLEAVQQLTNTAVATSVTCGHVWRDYVGGTADYFHPIIEVIPIEATAMALNSMRATVTDGSAGTGFSLKHAAAGAANYVVWTIKKWKVVNKAPA